MPKKRKTIQKFIKDLVFNNPRADRQYPMDGDFNDPDWLDRNMLMTGKRRKTKQS